MAIMRRRGQIAKYSYYYPEGAGYLFVAKVGRGSEGSTELVWCCADRKIYIRKKTLTGYIFHSNYDAHAAEQHLRAEVLAYRDDPSIPALIDWTYYNPLRADHPENGDFESTSMIFQYCNFGSLADLIDAYQADRADAHGSTCRLSVSECKAKHNLSVDHWEFLIPEALIWRILGQLTRVITRLHRMQPGILHHDLFSGNIFLHQASKDQILPDVFLGDFGKAKLIKPSAWDGRGQPVDEAQVPRHMMSDYEALINLVKELMTLYTPVSYTPGGQHRDYDRLEALFDLLETADVVNAYNDSNDKWYSIDPNNLDPTVLARHRADRAHRPCYTERLYAAIRQLEGMVKNFNDPDHYDYLVNHDHTFLAEAYEREANLRIPPRECLQNVAYPCVDLNFAAYRLVRNNNQVVRPHLFTKDEIIQQHHNQRPNGPWKIAEVQPSGARIWEVEKISKRTYMTYHPFQGYALQLGSDELRSDGDVSIPRSVRETSELDFNIHSDSDDSHAQSL